MLVSIISILKAMYQSQVTEYSERLKNIDYINMETLVEKVEKEIPQEEIPDNYDKIVEIIESIIRD
jgi:hypothetical protein